jgi:hypothetical protein
MEPVPAVGLGFGLDMLFSPVKAPSECGDTCIQDGSGNMAICHCVTPLVIDERITPAISRALRGQGEFAPRAIFQIIKTGDEGFLCDLFHCVLFSVFRFNALGGTNYACEMASALRLELPCARNAIMTLRFAREHN